MFIVIIYRKIHHAPYFIGIKIENLLPDRAFRALWPPARMGISGNFGHFGHLGSAGHSDGATLGPKFRPGTRTADQRFLARMVTPVYSVHIS